MSKKEPTINAHSNFYLDTLTGAMTHAQLKALYIEKVKAAKRNDIAFLKTLHGKHPELFDKEFLYNMLQVELQVTGKKLTREINTKIDEALNKPKM